MDMTACEKKDTQKGIDLFCKQSRIPSFELCNVFHSKNIRFVNAVASVKDSFDELHLEGMLRVSNSQSGFPIVREKIHSILAIMLENRFNLGVKDIFTKIEKEGGKYYSYCITRFNDHFLLPKINGTSEIEDALSRIFARKMKEFLGRGPKYCRSVIMDRRLLLFEVDGFFSLGEQERAADDDECAKSVENMAKQNLEQLFCWTLSDYNMLKCISICDIAGNKILVIVRTDKTLRNDLPERLDGES